MELNTILQGNSLEVLKTLPDNSVDSIVTDPPYELGFMGKQWDSTGIAYNVELWKECLRVLKHGGHLLAFGGTRTYHRMACAIEDAGFEIRDQIQWLYGSGFPKSYNISKGMDKKNGRDLDERYKLARHIKKKRILKGYTIKEMNEIFGYIAICGSWESENIHNNRIPNINDYIRLKKLLFLSDEFDWIVDRNEAEREVVGKGNDYGWESNNVYNGKENGKFGFKTDYDITKPKNEISKQWDGWGTALKPANEPIVMARKPLSEKTIVDNVIKWNVGGINIDECRVEFSNNESAKDLARSSQGFTSNSEIYHNDSEKYKTSSESGHSEGRFPANVILDEEAGIILDKQSGERPSGKGNGNAKVGENSKGSIQPLRRGNLIPRNDTGGASRFFYCAKATKKEKGEYNNHPTVKPIKLMEYLVRLITPKNGVVLDPFSGSGSTLVASKNEGCNFIGIEMEQEYIEIANKRLNT